MALTEQEQYIVDISKVWRFGSYLQGCDIIHSEMWRQIGKGNYPDINDLTSINEEMKKYSLSFDVGYLDVLPRKEINPLKVEQKAWELLSPLVRDHTEAFDIFLKNYSTQGVDEEQLRLHLNKWWNLLQKWNVISDSYGAKYGQSWDAVGKEEEAVKKLIQELQQTPPTVSK